jgi:predicted nucleic acid-binding protein
MRTNIEIDDKADGRSPEGFRTRNQEADGGTGAALDDQAATATRGRRGVRQIPLARQPPPQPQRPSGRVIVVDSSVWIDFLNGRNAPHVRRLRTILGTDEVIVGDLMLCEVLQGLDSERADRELETLLRRFEIVPMAGDAIAVAAARNFRSLRRRGITVRKTIDLLIGTWCIENRRPLLHNDGDFHPMASNLGLFELPVTT